MLDRFLNFGLQQVTQHYVLTQQGKRAIKCLAVDCRVAVSCCRRYYQPPSAYDRGVTGLTGTQGKPLWMVLTLLLTIVGSSLAVGFGWATHCHWALYAVGGGASTSPLQHRKPFCL